MGAIQIKQIIKIFLASSKELSNDRYAFVNFVRRLNKTYEKRGIRLDLFEWEDYDAAYNNRRKQDEYDDQIRDSDMFLALFRTRVGKFTIEEFEVAVEEFHRTGKKPKNYVYIHDLLEGEVETDELMEFKRRLSDEMGYYWIRYNNIDSLQLHFIIQLQQLVEGNYIDSLKVENGEVKFENMTIAQMDNLRFAAGNDDYQRMNKRLSELPGLIEKARLHVENYPNEEGFKDELQKLLNELNQLQKDFNERQQLLLNTALSISRLQGDSITDRMRRAIEAFEEGKVHEANIILDETEYDANFNLIDYRQSKELTEQERQIVNYHIKELWLKTSSVMADVSIPIDERIKQSKDLYAQADKLANEVDYDKKKYSDLLKEYAQFLNKYGLYKDAEEVCLHKISIAEELYGKEHENTATSYNEIGMVYDNKGNYSKALKYYFKALAIREKVLGTEHHDTATSYNNIGMVYYAQGDYGKALDYYFKALAIVEKVLGKEHPDTATSYNNIGRVYALQGDYDKTLEYYYNALKIYEKALGKEHPDTATSYNNIGRVYASQGDYDKALEYYYNALKIYEKALGAEHPDTATSYNNIGRVYASQGDNDKALEYYYNALKIYEKTLGAEHPDTATSYNNIGRVYASQGDNVKALEYYFGALKIYEKVLGTEHPSSATTYNNIGSVYASQGEYDKALEYFLKALAITERVLGKEHPSTAISYNNVGSVYASQGDYDKAVEYYEKALTIREKVLGKEHPDTIQTYNNIGLMYKEQGNYDQSIEYFEKAVAFSKKQAGENAVESGGDAIDQSSGDKNTRNDPSNLETARKYNNYGESYKGKGDYANALTSFLNALPILEKLRGEEHADTATAYNNTGYLYYHLGDYAKAQEFLKKAYGIREKLFGINNPDTEETSLLLEIVNVLIAYVETKTVINA